MVFKKIFKRDEFIGGTLGTTLGDMIRLRRCNFMSQALLSSFNQSTVAFIYFIFGIFTLRFTFFFFLSCCCGRTPFLWKEHRAHQGHGSYKLADWAGCLRSKGEVGAEWSLYSNQPRFRSDQHLILDFSDARFQISQEPNRNKPLLRMTTLS